jgi:hypothetical protein
MNHRKTDTAEVEYAVDPFPMGARTLQNLAKFSGTAGVAVSFGPYTRSKKPANPQEGSAGCMSVSLKRRALYPTELRGRSAAQRSVEQRCAATSAIALENAGASADVGHNCSALVERGSSRRLVADQDGRANTPSAMTSNLWRPKWKISNSSPRC